MITFDLKRQTEIFENYQGINLTEFSFKADHSVNDDKIADAFIRSSQFSYDSLRDCIKKEPDKGYLRRAFDIDKIKITDFKKYSKEDTAKFLIDYLNEPDWGDDRFDFSNLLDRYFEIHRQLSSSDFYVISKDWFDKDDERLIEPESWCYTHYFLIISVDRVLNLLTLTEWTYD